MYLPYAVGTLAAAAWSSDEIARYWRIEKIICKHGNPEEIVSGMREPALAAFSNYVWNFEFNLYTARLIKERFPSCMIVFGGHHISPHEKLLDKDGFIDFLIFGEGEEIFRELLLCLTSGEDLSRIPNIAYRVRNGIVQTEAKPICGTDYPSPYTMGVFDQIVEENPDTRFSAILETNRGCPYHCAYCDWGPLKTKVRMFPMERIRGDINWFASHKIDYVWGADGNFGLFDRDREIAELLVDAKKKYGYPQQIKVNYAKLNGDNVFYITKLFAENGLSKSTTMSLQSTSGEALRNTGRKNMSDALFSELISLYRRNNIPTYTELILALPGETKDSFFEGIGSIIASGQHSVIEVYDCLVLPNSTLADPDYMRKYGIRTVRLPYIQQHTSSVNFDIPEYNETVIETASMSAADRMECRYLAVVIQCFHSMGLLRGMAIYCYLEKNIAYTMFYTLLAEWLKTQKNGKWNLFPVIHEKIRLVNQGVNEQYILDSRFGDVYWPMDEGAFLNIIANYEEFYCEIRTFLGQFIAGDPVAEEALLYCKSTVRIPKPYREPIRFSYDFPAYYAAALENAPIPLEKRRCTVDAAKLASFPVFADYAREIVWFGRRSQKLNVIDSDKAFYYEEE